VNPTRETLIHMHAYIKQLGCIMLLNPTRETLIHMHVYKAVGCIMLLNPTRETLIHMHVYKAVGCIMLHINIKYLEEKSSGDLTYVAFKN